MTHDKGNYQLLTSYFKVLLNCEGSVERLDSLLRIYSTRTRVLSLQVHNQQINYISAIGKDHLISWHKCGRSEEKSQETQSTAP